jgi:hypothetical protein
MLMDMLTENSSHETPEIIWDFPVGVTVASIFGIPIGGMPAGSLPPVRNCAVFCALLRRMTCFELRSVMVDIVWPATSTSARAFVPLICMTIFGVAPGIIAANAPSRLVVDVTRTSARSGTALTAIRASNATGRFIAASAESLKSSLTSWGIPAPS